jgi:type II secretory pathway pseudopilin PulG
MGFAICNLRFAIDEATRLAASPRFSNCRSQMANRKSNRAFTLIEMLTTIAVLIIVLGLMVSLARNVRDRSAQQLTRDLLLKMSQVVAVYAESNGRQLPAVTSIIPPEAYLPPEEPALALLAKKNNEEFVRALRQEMARIQLHEGASTGARRRGSRGRGGGVFGQLPLSVYDGLTLRDAWGSPIVFMPAAHRWIGIAPTEGDEDAYFFFSAGPDRKFLTRDDNLYSYEMLAGETQ